jgi:phosphohistidine swiveling domain-containing protein
MTTALEHPVADPLHRPGAATEHWSTDNIGEAMPGVLSPLGADTWDWAAGRMLPGVAYALGIFTRAERDSAHRWFRLFYGRGALQVEYLGLVGDRMFGTSGREAVEGILGRAPEDMRWHPTRRRYPFVAARLPVVFATTPRRIRCMAAQTDRWWRAELRSIPGIGLDPARAVLAQARARFTGALLLQTLGLLGCIQPLYEALEALVTRTGAGDVAALSGSGGAEMAIVSALWNASRGAGTLERVIADHGFHGPREGDICARVWREDPSPLVRLLAGYGAREESESPFERERALRAEMHAARRAVLQALPPARRPAAGALMHLAAARIPLRGVAKRAFLQSLDVGRAAARRAGELLAAEGVLEDPEDVFYLTGAELASSLPPDVRELIVLRRGKRAEYERMRLPSNWVGTPAPLAGGSPPALASGAGKVLRGLGVSGGCVEGRVRVVDDPSFAEVEPGEVLVAPTTDPSWSSVMFVSAALVVDIGSALSHAAVVARELGIPCVVGTRDGSRALRTGDLVRVDGSAGTVELLGRGR